MSVHIIMDGFFVILDLCACITLRKGLSETAAAPYTEYLGRLHRINSCQHNFFIKLISCVLMLQDDVQK